MKIAMVGIRGVPAAYGGFETAVDEIGARLAADGHEIVVYCRRVPGVRPATHRGMRLVHLPSIRSKALETLSHTAVSVMHLVSRHKPDLVFLFNSANAPFLPLLRLARIPTAVHVDGLEWKRGKWGRLGRRYYRVAEALAVRWADALIADAQGIADYYREEFDAPTEILTYGAEIQSNLRSDRLAELGISSRAYHLVVARFEPENHVHVIVDGYSKSAATEPLVVVGSAPYAPDYTQLISELAGNDARIRLIGGLWDQEQLDQLYMNSLTYIHGHSVGGTNPSLLRAMGAGASIIAWDVNFNREVLGGLGAYFVDGITLATSIDTAEATESEQRAIGRTLQLRVAANYSWDDVAAGYGELAQKLVSGYRSAARSRPSGRRNRRSSVVEPMSKAGAQRTVGA